MLAHRAYSEASLSFKTLKITIAHRFPLEFGFNYKPTECTKTKEK